MIENNLPGGVRRHAHTKRQQKKKKTLESIKFSRLQQEETAAGPSTKLDSGPVSVVGAEKFGGRSLYAYYTRSSRGI
jgi:hypothetical protein